MLEGNWMKILFCGTHLPEKYKGELNYLLNVANRFQNNFVKHLRGLGCKVVELSYIGIPVSGKRYLSYLELYNEVLYI